MPNDLITDQLLDALAEVESRRNPNAFGDQGLRYPAYGMYQMREPAFQDVQRYQPDAAQGIGQLSDILGHPDVQRQLAQAYLQILHSRYGMQTEPDLLAAYNAGVGNVRRKRIPQVTVDYVRRVQQAEAP